MNIKVGEIYLDKVSSQKDFYPNKTRKYLLPCFNEYGELFMNKLNNVFKVAVGIGDVVLDNTGISHSKHLFILLDSSIAKKFFIEFLDWIREQPMYQDDYVFHNIQRSTFHMIVLTVPVKFQESFEHFKVGRYSKMYPIDIVNLYFSKQGRPGVLKVLTGDKTYKVVFARKVNALYGTTISPEDIEGELDFPPTPEGDIFNHHLKKH